MEAITRIASRGPWLSTVISIYEVCTNVHDVSRAHRVMVTNCNNCFFFLHFTLSAHRPACCHSLLAYLGLIAFSFMAALLLRTCSDA